MAVDIFFICKAKVRHYCGICNSWQISRAIFNKPFFIAYDPVDRCLINKAPSYAKTEHKTLGGIMEGGEIIIGKPKTIG
jgi:hypothetical protein